VLQQRWTNTYGPNATGEFADRSYWLCTENWPNQNYPKDLAVYNKMGGFSNGYVPLFIIVGFENKVYWDGNSENWETALKLAISQMATEGVYLDNPFEDQTLIFGDERDFELSGIFRDMNENPVTVSLESNSNPDVASVTIENNTMTITASNTNFGTTTITLIGTAGSFSATDEFDITVYDSNYYNIESLETGTFDTGLWGFSGDAGWSIDNTVYYDGNYSAKSNKITHNQKSEMYLEAEYPTAGKISFRGKASSELGYDQLKFFIDGIEKKRISGLTGWLEGSFDVDTGNHVFKWSYQKDGSSSLYEDCAWVDYIVFLGGMPTGIENLSVPAEVRLLGNYPNPFNPNTIISFETEMSGLIKLSVYNQKGEFVQNIFEGDLKKGHYNYNFNASDLTSGIYFYKLETENHSLMKKMILLK